jgi:probable rRNA maturation factor
VSLGIEIDNRAGWRIDEDGVRRVVSGTLEAEGVGDAEVGVAFVEPGEMATLNGEHRGVEGPTDVLSFPIDEDEGLPGVPRQLGDVVVCPHVAAEEGTPIATLLVHGVLHLLGWDHEQDRGDMLRREEQLVAGAGTVGAERA